MRKLIPFREFYDLKVKNSEQKQRDITGSNEFVDTVSKVYPCAAFFFVDFGDGSDEPYYEHYEVLLDHPELSLRVSYDGRQKKWNIYNQSIFTLKNVTYYTQEAIEKNIPKPRQIGKLSAKKVQEWVYYHEQVYKQLVEVNNGNAANLQAFLGSIKDLPVKWFDGNKQGSIVRNGIELEFKIEPTYVSKKIVIHWSVENDVASFLKLSDNKYEGKK